MASTLLSAVVMVPHLTVHLLKLILETIKKCSCFNPFTGKPLFFFSDPPHLIKKLRNNLYSSGQKAEHQRYTRTLLFNDSYILWNHVYAVYQRESRRHLYVTDLRKAHVTIDSVSKMRVKLAVHTLSEKVAAEMEECDEEATVETRKYIKACAKFWNIFNDPTPMKTSNDKRMTELKECSGIFHFLAEMVSSKVREKERSIRALYFMANNVRSDSKSLQSL